MHATEVLVDSMDHSDSDRHSGSNIVALGKLLKQQREAAGLSQEALASKAGVSRVSLSHLENAVYQQPSPGTLARIGKTLGISMDDIYALTGYTAQADLPSLRVYLMAKHPDWPEECITAIEDYCEFVCTKHELPE
jgi:transcriptional regulator with XRE-family HTH domain